jgi:hypothetical protein
MQATARWRWRLTRCERSTSPISSARRPWKAKWFTEINTSGARPVHVHGAAFQVVSRTGGRAKLFPLEGGWKDTVTAISLEHEGMGMMTNFKVV